MNSYEALLLWTEKTAEGERGNANENKQKIQTSDSSFFLGFGV